MAVSAAGRRLKDSLFWVSGGRTWRDRLRLLFYWLSPRFLNPAPGPPTPIQSPLLESRTIYLRMASLDVRVFRNIFIRQDYALPAGPAGEAASIVDLGAYTGFSTLYCARRYPSATVIALEPDDENYACFQKNVGDYLASGRVKALQACVSNVTGTVQFKMQGESWARSMVAKGGVEVPAFSLTDLFEKYGLEKVDILKMDIEGAEKQVFESAGEWLDRVGWILIEIHAPSMTLAQLQEAVLPVGRRIYRKRSGSSPGWVDVSSGTMQAGESMMDLIVPPAGWSI